MILYIDNTTADNSFTKFILCDPGNKLLQKLLLLTTHNNIIIEGCCIKSTNNSLADAPSQKNNYSIAYIYSHWQVFLSSIFLQLSFEILFLIYQPLQKLCSGITLYSISDMIIIQLSAYTNFFIPFKKSHYSQQPILILFSGLIFAHLGPLFLTKDKSRQILFQDIYSSYAYITLTKTSQQLAFKVYN